MSDFEHGKNELVFANLAIQPVSVIIDAGVYKSRKKKFGIC